MLALTVHREHRGGFASRIAMRTRCRYADGVNSFLLRKQRFSALSDQCSILFSLEGEAMTHSKTGLVPRHLQIKRKRIRRDGSLRPPSSVLLFP